MNNDKNYINTNIYAIDPLETLFESSTDSAAPPYQHTPETAESTSPRVIQRQQTATTTQNHAAPELMTQLLDLQPSELHKAETAYTDGLAQIMRKAFVP